jgi:hypothetical protein
MLPAIAPHARIMRYGYDSQWFGKEAVQLKVPAVAARLLRALQRKRTVQTLCVRNAIIADLRRIIHSGHSSSYHIALGGWSC